MGFISDNIVLEIRSDQSSVLLNLIYYIGGEETWTARQPGIIGASSGTWGYANVSNGIVTLRAVNPNTRQTDQILILNGLGSRILGDPFRQAGQNGRGIHCFSGGVIPINEDISWRVVSIT